MTAPTPVGEQSIPATTRNGKFAAVIEHFSVGHRTVGEMVVAVLRQAIQSGVFEPGEWLRQEYLADTIGVSRVPVRTALLQLETEGLVTVHAHRGAQVRAQSPAQIEEIYRLRVLLELYALPRSMAAMTSDRLDRLRTLAERLDAESEGSDFLRARVEFYRELYDSKRNPVLVEHIENLRSQLGRYLLGFRFDTHQDHHHGALVDRVAARDLNAAESWLRNHLETVRAGIIRAAHAAVELEKPATVRRGRRTDTAPATSGRE